MNKTSHKSFKFLDWQLDADNYQLLLNYQLEAIGKVTEVFSFPNFNYARLQNKEAIDKACELIHLMCGVSYYKSELATEISFNNKLPSVGMAGFIAKTWKNGLAEMAFENNISLKGLINFKGEKEVRELTTFDTEQKCNKSLVAIGGGKDSLVTIEELKEQGNDICLFMVGSSKLIKQVAKFTSLPLLQVARKIDPKLIEYNKNGALNGHVPITAINSSIGILCALLFGFDSVVFSNERSAESANTINSDGENVNHQYSKSYEFEKDISKILAEEITSDVRYYSQQRNYSELAILKKFSLYPQYFPVFSSCNRNFHIDGSKNKDSKWCCNCPKCRFVFLGLAPFVKKQQLLDIFKTDLLNDKTQLGGFAELLGLKGFKPFECVGEVEESQLAFNMVKDKTDWKDCYVIKEFKDSCPQTTDEQQQQIMRPSLL